MLIFLLNSAILGYIYFLVNRTPSLLDLIARESKRKNLEEGKNPKRLRLPLVHKIVK